MYTLLLHSYNALFLENAILKTSPGRLCSVLSFEIDHNSDNLFTLVTHHLGGSIPHTQLMPTTHSSVLKSGVVGSFKATVFLAPFSCGSNRAALLFVDPLVSVFELWTQ